MAIKRIRVNPLIVIECVVVGIERDARADERGTLIDKGRKLTVQTAQGPELELKVPLAGDEIAFEQGVPLLINVEYLEWEFTDEQGRDRAGSTMKFHSFASPNQLDRWQGIVRTQGKVAAA